MHLREIAKILLIWPSLVVQWLRIRLPMQGTQFLSLAWEDSTCLEQLSPCTTTPEACAPRTHAPQEKSL